MSTMMESVGADVRLAVRGVGRRPGFALMVVLTLALGMGANAAIFRVLDRVLLRPLPYAGGDRMVYVGLHSPEAGFSRSPRQVELERWREGARTLEAIEAFRSGSRVADIGGSAELLDYTEVSAGMPALIGMRPLVGRTFLSEDHAPGAPPVVLLGEGFWRSAFGGDPGVVGRDLELDGTLHTVVGVWPADASLGFEDSRDLWLPVERGSEADPRRFTKVLALLAPGATPAAAEDEMAALLEGVETESARTWIPRLNPPHHYLSGTFVSGLRIGYVGVVVVLLVALVNAAGLLLNRAVAREGELGVRLALGGSGARLVRLFLVEGAVLAFLGAAAATLVAGLGGRVLEWFAPPDFPRVGGEIFDPTLVLYLGGLAVACTLVCGLVPALHVRSPRVRRLLTGRGSVGRTPWQGLLSSGLVAGQVALALVLVVGAGLTVRSLVSIRSIDPGFDVERLAVFSVRLPEGRYDTSDEREVFFRRARERLEAVPGVEGVTLSGAPPFRFSISSGGVHLAGEPPQDSAADFTATAGARPGYFEVMGIPVLEGRSFTRADAGRNVVMVNEAFSRRYAGRSVVGATLRFSDSDTDYTIVGVAGDVRALGLVDDPERIQIYHPDLVHTASYGRFMVRSAGPPGELLPALRREVAQLDPGLPLRSVTTGPELLEAQTVDERFLALLLAVFSAVALVLAVLGVYGSVALAVSRRTREMGVRIALGAAVSRVLRSILGRGLRPVLAGIVVGALVALGLSRQLEGVLHDIPPTDALSYVLGAALLLGAGGVACLVPARRALGVEPSQVLREE